MEEKGGISGQTPPVIEGEFKVEKIEEGEDTFTSVSSEPPFVAKLVVLTSASELRKIGARLEGARLLVASGGENDMH